MRTTLHELLESQQFVLADGATGTNYFARGLESGEPPEFWNIDKPHEVRAMHDVFIESGADIILTNSFGCNRHRLKLHNMQHRTFELNKLAAELAVASAESARKPVVVAGSVGPTGELFEPLGALTEAEGIDTFVEQIEGLKAGGADVIWIETMSATEELRSAALAAIKVGMPYTATCSFDTAGRTMMGLAPGDLGQVFADLPVAPVAMGANCGVGASDILASLLAMSESHASSIFISKGNCGVPEFRGADIHYTGTPELMGRYAELACAAGARIVGGCCGTTPEHLAQMRQAIDAPGFPHRPSLDDVVANVGPLINAAPGAAPIRERKRSGRARP